MPQLQRLLLLAGLVTCIGAASAQSYPTKPIRIIVPVVAGGSPDIFARLIGPRLHGWIQAIVATHPDGRS